MVILAAAVFALQSKYHKTKDKSPDQIVFARDMTIPINHVAGWRYISQLNQVQINKDLICENNTRINYDYRVGYKVRTRNKSACKYETPFKGLYEIVQT